MVLVSNRTMNIKYLSSSKAAWKIQYPGTGIGLAICKKIVLNHNGIIRATGKPGEGSVFSVYIPHDSRNCISTYIICKLLY